MTFIKLFKYARAFLGDLLYAVIRDGESVIARRLRQTVYQTTCHIDSSVVIANKKNFLSGSKSALYHGTYILNNHGHFSLGDNSHLGAMCYVNVNYGLIQIGADVAIGPQTSLIAYSNHYGIEKRVSEEKIIGNIYIGDNVFIGANCTILPNTTISENVVIGAGSVVKGDFESNAVYAGIPCRKIKGIV